MLSECSRRPSSGFSRCGNVPACWSAAGCRRGGARRKPWPPGGRGPVPSPSIRSHHPALRRTAPREPESCLEKKEKAGGLGGLFQDQEQLFLLMLAVLLIKNGAQMEIVLALLYIAM